MSLIPLLALLLSLTTPFAQDCRVVLKEVVRSIYGTGYVKASRQVVLKASVSGYVKHVLVVEGDRVSKGELLVVIDSAGLENRIRSLEERISLLERKLEKNSPFMGALEEEVLLRKEVLEKAERRLRRRERLYSKGVIPREHLEEAERLYTSALREYRIAKLKVQNRIEELKAELSSLRQSKKALEKQENLYRVKSPLAGVVLKVWVEEGDYVNHVGRDNLLVSVGSEEKIAILQIDEEYAPLVSVGNRAYIVSDAFPERVFEGRVEKIELESDRSRRVVNVKIKAPLPRKIPVNSLLEGNIVVSKLKTTVVPIGAVRGGNVLLLVEGKKKRVPVGRLFEEYAEVLGYPPGTPCIFPQR